MGVGCELFTCPYPLKVQTFPARGEGRNSEVERSLMVRWVVGSIIVAYVAAAGFLSHYQNGPYPYV